MATPEVNENCHFVQNDPHSCKIKLKKFRFDILSCFRVIKESLPMDVDLSRPSKYPKYALNVTNIIDTRI